MHTTLNFHIYPIIISVLKTYLVAFPLNTTRDKVTTHEHLPADIAHTIQAVHLHKDVLFDSAWFLNRVYLDPLLFIDTRLRSFVENNGERRNRRELKDIVFDYKAPEGEARIIVSAVLPNDVPAGTVRRVMFEGSTADVLGMQEQFHSCLAYSAIGCIELGCTYVQPRCC